MSDKKVIVVIGATGAQGGGLVRAILNDKNGDFSVRAVTRNVNSDKAKHLADLGAEVVAADVDDLESIKRAFAGAYGAYCVTFFWEHFSPQKEQDNVKHMAEAAKTAGLKHVIWSTLEDTRNWIPLSDNRMPTLMEKYKVPHFDAKGEANTFFDEAVIPTTFLLTSFYWENFIYFGMGPKKGPDGKLAISLPMGEKKLPGIATEDIGKCAFAIFQNGNDFIGKTVGISGEHLTGQQMADSFSKAFAEDIAYNALPHDVYRGFDFPGAEDLGNMFQFKHDFENYFCGARDLDFSKSLNPSMQSFDEWLSHNKNSIPLD